MRSSFLLCLLVVSSVFSREVVQISDDGTETIPAQSIATPAQIADISDTATEAKSVGELALERAEECAEKVALYSTNYLVTSTVYVRSIGAVPYDPSNQTINVSSFFVGDDTIEIIGTVRQIPIVMPSLDWRQTLGDSGAWSNISATVTETALPTNAVDAIKAYKFVLPKPGGGSALFRIVDNSSGASGSGLYWVVFGCITVDGHKGATLTITNVVDGATNTYQAVGGIITGPDPIGDL